MSLKPRTRKVILKNNETKTIGASQTDVQISEDFAVFYGLRLRLDIRVSSLTHVTGVTFKLQTSPGTNSLGTPIWKDVKSISSTASISSDDFLTLTINPEVAGDVAALPLGLVCRLLCSTGAGESVTITQISCTEHSG